MACPHTLRLPLPWQVPQMPQDKPKLVCAEGREINPQTAPHLQKPLPGKASTTPCNDTRRIPARSRRRWLQARALASCRRLTEGPRGTMCQRQSAPLPSSPHPREPNHSRTWEGQAHCHFFLRRCYSWQRDRSGRQLPSLCCTSLGITRLFLTQQNLRRAHRKPATLPARGRRQVPLHPKASREGSRVPPCPGTGVFSPH